MPRVINRYVFKEIAAPFLLSLAILTATALLSKIMKIIELMFTHGAGAGMILRFVASAIPSFLVYTLPISFLIGVLVALTRLSSDSEITAMKASGLSLFNLVRPVFALSFISFAVTVFVSVYLFPWGNINLKRIAFEAARARMFSGLEEKSFYDKFKGVVLYVDRLNQGSGEMEGIFISETDGAEANIFFARRGALAPAPDETSVILKLYDGSIHRRAEAAYHIVDFSSYALDLGLTGAEAGKGRDRHNRELYIGEFLERMDEARARGENPAPYQIDLHKRFALPASVFVFAVIGIPLGIQRVRAAKLTGFSVAIAIVLAYYVLSTAFEALGENGVLNPVLAVWGSDIAFAAFGLFIFGRAAKDRPVELSALLSALPFRSGKRDSA